MKAKDVNKHPFFGLKGIRLIETAQKHDGTKVEIEIPTDKEGRAIFRKEGKTYFLTHEAPAMRVSDAVIAEMHGVDVLTGIAARASNLFDFSGYGSKPKSEKVIL